MTMTTKSSEIVQSASQSPSELAKRVELLTDDEREAYEKALKLPPLSVSTSMQLCRLFLQGYSTSEIAKQNPSMGSVGLGLIVRARVEYGWDKQREEYINNLMGSARKSVEKTTLEAIQMAADGMAVYHRVVGDRFKKFIQTGDTEDLGEWKDFSFQKYRQIIELMTTLVAQVQGANHKPLSDVGSSPEPKRVEVIDPAAPNRPLLPADKPVTAQDAASMLEFLLKEEKK
jgi:hypothetical protein